MLDAPKYRAPGEIVWSSRPFGNTAQVVSPWGWHEKYLIPFGIFAGLACYLAAVAAAVRRRFGVPTIVATGGSLALLVPVTVWLLV
ncbi:hypothetical protein FNH05_10830 [Amycolatopsis rhizosphaerae]|uniref:Uncharacterized protein n=1 Tax=Amycolatopsis rhizosphaerae TaxID=2053003 RepID=A0A558CZD5_9PSEU|nr:hypothetical protein [Amycolatopsis rhizosphaerae]TVT54083.1 hypothetical protein FNH05_10830 [Amycolatopsis rhizosphaerae]